MSPIQTINQYHDLHAYYLKYMQENLRAENIRLNAQMLHKEHIEQHRVKVVDPAKGLVIDVYV